MASKSLHIYTNGVQQESLCGIALCDLSDHYPVFAIVLSQFQKKKANSIKYLRNMIGFQIEGFLEDLNERLKFVTDSNKDSVDKQFQEFIHIFASVVSTHAPLKKASRKERKIKIKPWLTQGLIRSIHQKNRLFSRSHKNRDEQLFNEYKKYRNVLNRTIERAKRNYYNQRVALNKNNPNQLWKTINDIANIKSRNDITPRNF